MLHFHKTAKTISGRSGGFGAGGNKDSVGADKVGSERQSSRHNPASKQMKMGGGGVRRMWESSSDKCSYAED